MMPSARNTCLRENRTAAIQTIDRCPDDGKALDRGVHSAYFAIPGECRGLAAQRRLGPLVPVGGRPAAVWQASLRGTGTATATCARRGPGEEFLLIPVPGLVFCRRRYMPCGCRRLVRRPRRPFTGCTPG